MRVPLRDIKVPADYPTQDLEGIVDLARDIQSRGLLDPIELLEPNGDGLYTLRHGRRRLAAVSRLGLDEVPAEIIRSSPTTSKAESENTLTPKKKRRHAGGIKKGHRFPPGSTSRSRAAIARREQLLPLLHRNLSHRELGERFDVAPSTIGKDINALIEEGRWQPQTELRYRQGVRNTMKILDNSAIMLTGLIGALDGLSDEDLTDVGEDRWEADFTKAIRALTRVRRLLRKDDG